MEVEGQVEARASEGAKKLSCQYFSFFLLCLLVFERKSGWTRKRGCDRCYSKEKRCLVGLTKGIAGKTNKK